MGPSHAARALSASGATICKDVALWSGQHLAALVASVLLAALLVVVARRSARGGVIAARVLAAAIATAFALEHITYALRGEWRAQVNLPLQLSDAITAVSVAALLRPRVGLLVELTYFWALSASVQAVLTPGLAHRFPDVLFFTYFGTHVGAIGAACLLVFGMRRVPRTGAVGRVWLATLGFTLLAAIGTLVTGGNFMFLRHKPVNGSLLDVLGPWPVYIVVAAIIGLLIFVALAALSRRAAER